MARTPFTQELLQRIYDDTGTMSLELLTEALTVLTVCVVLFALLTWYTERQTWLELPLHQEPVENTTDSVQARYGAYIQLQGKRYN